MADLLIVDDDADLSEVLSEFLRCLGHEVRMARNGDEGIAKLRERLPDLIVLDIEMPVMTGPEMAIQLLLQDAGMEKIPVILSSGMPDLERIAETVGSPYFLAKPWQPDDLAAMLDRALAERRLPHPSFDYPE